MQKNQDDNLLLSVDELLSSLTADLEVKKKEDVESSKKWSMDEIDALLGIADDKKSKPKEQAKAVASEPAFAQEELVQKEEPDTILNAKTVEIPSVQDEESEDNNFASDKTRVFNSAKVIENAIAVFDKEAQDGDIESSETDSFFESIEASEKTERDLAKTNIVRIDKNLDKGFSTMELATEYVKPEKAVSEKTLSDVFPTYNEDIKHNIKSNKVERDFAGMENDKYRERFINRPVQNLEKTADYERLHLNAAQQKVERPGIIVKKKGFSNTADLEPIPTIISADDELKNVAADELAKEAKNPTSAKDSKKDEHEIAGQIKLSGFEEQEEIEKIDEEFAENSLKKVRKEKLKHFKLNADLDDFSESETDEDFLSDEETEETSSIKSSISSFSSDYIEDEYEKPEDKSRILKQLSRATKFSFAFFCIEVVILIASIVISVIVRNAGGNVSVIGGNVVGHLLINLLLLLLSCIFGLSTFVKGISGLISFKLNEATGTVIVFLMCVIQCFVLIFTAKNAAFASVIYAPVACFAFTVSVLSRFIVLKRALGNFEFCTGGTALHSTEKITNDVDAFEIGRGLLLGEPDLRYSSRIKFLSNFCQNSFSTDPADALCSKLVPAVIGASLIIAIITGFVSKSVLDAFLSFVAICSIGIPAFSMFASNLPLLITNKKLNSQGGAILGHKAILDCVGTNAIVVDSSELFKKGRCGIDGIKTFHSMRIDEAILDAAALVIESGGPLVDIFDGVILGRREILPPVESLAYEDRLGLSAWIHGRRILLGSRDLLINHNVEVPDIEVETKYIKRGKKVMYLSVAGKVGAMFVISYYANDAIGSTLRKIEETGLTILVRTCDYNITEELLCEYFKLPLSAVKIISPNSGDIFNKYRKTTLENSSSGLFHNGTEESFLTSVVQAIRLNKLISINCVVQIIYSSIAVAVFALLSFLAGLSSISAVQIIIFQFFWTFLASIISVFKKS
ncbi:MAG: hypothetical protein EOM05_03090 [Clostridia bacterium]|nr:hypothetical protein [Clostridia bacterium]